MKSLIKTIKKSIKNGKNITVLQSSPDNATKKEMYHNSTKLQENQTFIAFSSLLSRITLH